ncbi:MAG: hypothetical protein QM723_35415 [Myxococcaceae bacterium]
MRGLVPALLLFAVACKEPAAPAERVKLNRLSGTSFELVPGESKLPYCLAYTVANNGTIRQLTMSKDNLSFHCNAGKPIGGHPYKVPLEEGPVKVHVLQTSQRVSAASVARQILELSAAQSLHPLNLRLPGEAALVTMDFAPEADVAPMEGEVVTLDAGASPVPEADAGIAAGADGG